MIAVYSSANSPLQYQGVRGLMLSTCALTETSRCAWVENLGSEYFDYRSFVV